MSSKLTEEQKIEIRKLLFDGLDSKSIADYLGISARQVAAIAAHVTMGSYKENFYQRKIEKNDQIKTKIFPKFELTKNKIYLGSNIETEEDVYWDPFPESGITNPHTLILGESGVGKTETIKCLIAELAQKGFNSIVFDYGQGFSVEHSSEKFNRFARVNEFHVNKDGVNINPFQMFPTDLHGPLNVAQRIADSFQRIYTQIGIQQHAVLRNAIIQLMDDYEITITEQNTWNNPLPWFNGLMNTLNRLAEDRDNPQRKIAASLSSHISTVFLFDIFRDNGVNISWNDILNTNGRTHIIQLKGLERSLEKVVTELMLWNLIGYVESMGPGPIKLFIVLDEAHKLSIDEGSPVEKLLREGRKFGLGIMLASQEVEDFSKVAFSNTATKLIFRNTDDNSVLTRLINKNMTGSNSFDQIRNTMPKLKKGHAYFISNDLNHTVKIRKLENRFDSFK